MNSSPSYWVVIPAAGVGSRMAADKPKQYIEIGHKTILQHTLEPFCQHPNIERVVVVVSAEDPFYQQLNFLQHEKIMTTFGGDERCHSVLNGLKEVKQMADNDDWVLVHDAARPCIDQNEINHLMQTLSNNTVGGILAWPVRDTMKRSDKNQHISDTVDREGLWHALTPQMFRLQLLHDALCSALEQKSIVTDEAQAVEASGHRPQLVAASCYTNKITTPADLMVAEQYLKTHRRLS